MARRNARELADKVAIVTGGASGIGKALGAELCARGCEVVLADRQGDVVEGVAKGLRDEGSRASAAELDVRDLAAFQHVVAETRVRAGRVDFLFNNAGIAVGGEIDRYRPEDWDDVFDVNLRGVAYGVQAAYPVMLEQRAGHIVNTASVAGLVPSAGEASYTASKHAVVALTRALRIEARRHGVRASALCPGAIRTPILTGGRFGRVNLKARPDQLMTLWEKVRPMDPAVLARRAVDAVLRDEAIIVEPRWWKAFWYLDRLSPTLSEKLWGAALERLRADIARFEAEASGTNGAHP
jgi:NAD(P)-dependent dehydrogenase (short-subunit alcohol dehydrogenase family)